MVVCRLLIAVASFVAEHGLCSCGSRALERRLSSCGAWASLLRSMWDLPGQGIKPMSPALASRFLTTEPPGKPYNVMFYRSIYCEMISTIELVNTFINCIIMILFWGENT